MEQLWFPTVPGRFDISLFVYLRGKSIREPPCVFKPEPTPQISHASNEKATVSTYGTHVVESQDAVISVTITRRVEECTRPYLLQP
jgi:hypothetical protein